MITMMRPSAECIALVKQFEGCKLTAYQDGAGVWTIGYGHTENVKEGDSITQGQAEIFLECDLIVVTDAVSRLVKITLLQCEFDALCDFVFNEGSEHLATSTLLRKLNLGDLEGAENEFVLWDFVGSQVEKGLRERRIAERNMFAGGLARP